MPAEKTPRRSLGGKGVSENNGGISSQPLHSTQQYNTKKKLICVLIGFMVARKVTMPLPDVSKEIAFQGRGKIAIGAFERFFPRVYAHVPVQIPELKKCFRAYIARVIADAISTVFGGGVLERGTL